MFRAWADAFWQKRLCLAATTARIFVPAGAVLCVSTPADEGEGRGGGRQTDERTAGQSQISQIRVRSESDQSQVRVRSESDQSRIRIRSDQSRIRVRSEADQEADQNQIRFRSESDESDHWFCICFCSSSRICMVYSLCSAMMSIALRKEYNNLLSALVRMLR